MIEKVKSELLPLTRAVAIQFAEMRPLPGERQLREARVKYFQGRAASGKFRSPRWSQALVGEDPNPWRGDGQHTSHVLSHLEEAQFPQGLNVTIETWQLDDMSQSAEFFDMFDNPISARSNLDKLGVYVAEFADLKDIEHKFINRILGGIHFFQLDLIKQQEQQGNKVALIVNNARDRGVYLHDADVRSFVIWIHQWYHAHNNWMFEKPGITAEIYADWKALPQIAEDFWGEVLLGSNPDPEDETRELARVLAEWAEPKRKTKQDKFRARVRKTWNRYRKLNAPPPLHAPAAPTGVEPSIPEAESTHLPAEMPPPSPADPAGRQPSV
jgi:hypothetical protein